MNGEVAFDTSLLDANESESSTKNLASDSGNPQVVILGKRQQESWSLQSDSVMARLTKGSLRSEKIILVPTSGPSEQLYLGDATHQEIRAYREHINSLPGEPFNLLKPIPVKIERMDENDFLASFEEANITMPGESDLEAFQNLLGHTLDVFEALSNEETSLGPEPARQLKVLRKYLSVQR